MSEPLRWNNRCRHDRNVLSTEISVDVIHKTSELRWCDQHLWVIPHERREHLRQSDETGKTTTQSWLGCLTFPFFPNMKLFKKATRKQINKRTWYIKYDCSECCRSPSVQVHIHKGTKSLCLSFSSLRLVFKQTTHEEIKVFQMETICNWKVWFHTKAMTFTDDGWWDRI